MPRDEAVYRNRNSVIAHSLTSKADVDAFIENIRLFVRKVNAQTQTPQGQHYGKPVNIVVSIVTGEDKLGPLVDMEWACAALPCTPATLKYQLKRCRMRLDAPLYRRVKRPDGRGCSRIRMLSLHDLRVLRGAMVVGPGRERLLASGEIE